MIVRGSMHRFIVLVVLSYACVFVVCLIILKKATTFGTSNALLKKAPSVDQWTHFVKNKNFPGNSLVTIWLYTTALSSLGESKLKPGMGAFQDRNYCKDRKTGKNWEISQTVSSAPACPESRTSPVTIASQQAVETLGSCNCKSLHRKAKRLKSQCTSVWWSESPQLFLLFFSTDHFRKKVMCRVPLSSYQKRNST